MIRNILAVIAGYAIFVITAVLFFRLAGHDPHTDPTIIFALVTAAYGAIFSFIGGFICRLISKTKDLKVNYILALILAGFAFFSLLKTGGNHWTQLLAIFIFAPVSVLGGLFYQRRRQKLNA